MRLSFGAADALRPLAPRFALLPLLLLAISANAAVLRVKPDAPGPAHDGATWNTAYLSLTTALTASASGDEIWVSAATYTERITLKSGVAMYGGFVGTEANRTDRAPQTNVTAIDGTNGVTVTVANGAAAATRLDGFTVVNGAPGISLQSGAATVAGCTVASCAQGITLGGGTPTITACTIRDNTNSGIFGTAGSATVTNNTISNNRDFGVRADGTPLAITGNAITGSGAGAGSGTAAIVCSLDAAAAPAITGNTLTNNNGSGVSTTNGQPKIKNNVIKGNTGTQGGGIYCSGGTVLIADNVMAINSSFKEGGGVYAKNAVSTIVNNTLAANSSGGQGGALYIEGGTATVVNNIIAYNAPGIYVNGGTTNLRRNCVYGNLVYAYAGVAAGATDIAADPQIAGPVSRDLHIQPTSPCKDTGDNTVVVAGDKDMDGQARIQPALGTVDIGADESDGTLYNIPTPILYVKPAAQGGDDANSGLSWSAAKATVQAAINAAAGGGEVWVQTGQYVEQLTLKNGVSMYGGFAGIETSKGQRTGKFLTVLDGGGSDAVITIPVGVGSPETIDGFQITNGKLRAMIISLAGVDITNNTFFNNGSNTGNQVIRSTNSALNLRGNVIRDNGAYALVADTCTVNASGNTVKNNGGGLYFTAGSNLTADTNAITGNGREAISGDSGIATVTSNTVSANGYGIGWTGYLTATGNTISANGQYGISGSGTLIATNNTVSANTSGIGWTSGTATVTGNTLTGNSNGYNRAAISVSGAATITNNSVTGNSTCGIGWASVSASTAVITGNTVSRNNGSASGGTGGGIDVSGGAPSVQNNVISGNVALYGGGIYADQTNATIANNLVYANGVPNDGAGIYVNQGQPSVINNTVAANSAPGQGGGIAVNNSRPVIANNLVVYNTSGLSRTANSTINLSHNDVWSNSGQDFQGFPVTPVGQGGNISVDPLLAGPPARNLHIQPGSPARNAGDNTVLVAGWVDMDGEARSQGGTVDIGADESYGQTYTGIAQRYYVNLATGADTNDGLTWATSKKTIQAGIDAAAGGAEVWVATGTYKEKITFAPGVSLYGGFAGSETSRTVRDFITNLTVLDAQMTGDVVTVPAGTGATVRVDGFTIGNRTTGSTSTGVVLNDSALVLANDIITLNRTGLTSAGGVLTLDHVSLPDNDSNAVTCTVNSFLTMQDSQITGNGRDAVNGDSGTLIADRNSVTGNGWAGYAWTGNATIRGTTVQGNGYGISVSGTVLISGNTVQNNGGVFSNTGIGASGNVNVDNNTVTGNANGGIRVSGSSPVLTGYTVSVTRNTVTGNTSGSYAGVYIQITGSASGLVQLNSITGNAAGANGNGGGLYVDGSAPEIQRNVIAENTASYGGGVYVNKGSALLANNFISGNTATNNGGGIYLYQGTPNVINNSIAANSAGANGTGGGIYADAATSTVANNIIAFNTAGGLLKTTPASLNLSHNDVYGNLPYDYSGYAAPPTGTNGNIALDPHLVQPSARNLHIQEDSPCINAGDNTVVVKDWVDIDGQNRITPAAGIVDIGADESYGEHYVVTPLVIRVDGSAGNDANDGSTWPKAKRTIQAGIDAAKGGGEVWVAGSAASPPVAYTERVTLRSGIALYGGFVGNETTRAVRDIAGHPSVIDGQNGGDVVTVPSAAGSVETIDGFTIGNKTTGSTSSGINVTNASLILTNCVITLNQNGITSTGSVVTAASTNILNNSRHGIACTLSSNINLDTVQVKSNGQNGVTGDSGSLTMQNVTLASNGWSALDWRNGASAIAHCLVQANGYGAYMTGAVTFTDNTVQGNGRTFSLDAVTAIGYVTLARNQILNNATSGLYCEGDDPVLTGYTLNVTDNVVKGNAVSNDVAGVYCKLTGTATALIQHNAITGNYNTYLQGTGGGLFLDGGAPTVLNNTIQGNAAGYGGGVYCNSTNAVLANNLIVSNGVNNSGGGVYAYKGAPVFVNNTITANSASSDGGALFADASSVTLTNTIAAYNSPGISKNTAATLTMSHNDVFGNAGYDASGFVLTNNLNVDPGLAGPPARNLHILPTSALRNAGDTSAIPTNPAWQDMDGQNRLQGAAVDVGADESYGETYPPLPLIIRVNAASGDDSKDGTTWAKAKQTIQAGIEAAAGGGEVWVAGGAYHELIVMRTAVALYGGFSGSETVRSGRNPATNATVIDGDNSGSVVTVPFSSGAAGVIDGFTIQKSASNAAGISCANTALNLVNVTVTASGTGISASGCLLNFSFVSIVNSAATALDCTANTSVKGDTVTVLNTASNAYGVRSDSGTLNVSNLSVQGAGYAGVYWTNGTVTLNKANITQNGYGMYVTGSLTMTNSVLQGNGHTFSSPTIGATGFVTLRNNRIIGNSSTAISAQGDLPVLTGYTVTITDNVITANTGQSAVGGVYVRTNGTASTLVQNNVISYNSNNNGAGTGAGLVLDQGSPFALNNVILGNVGGNGAGVYVASGSATLANNFILNNTSSSNGGGVYLFNGSPALYNNTVASNGATGGNGGGVNVDGASATLTNNIIALNANGGVNKSASASVTMASNDVFGNGGYQYKGMPDPLGTNVKVDPVFQDAANLNFHLKAASPLINQADDSVLDITWKDIDGQARKVGTHMDMGADEFSATGPLAIVFATQPGGAPAGLPFAPQPVIRCVDASNNTVAAFTGPISMALKSGTGAAGASLFGTSPVNSVAGVAAFTDLGIDKLGAGYVITASNPVMGMVDSGTLNVSIGGFTAPDLKKLLQIVAGINKAQPSDVARFDVDNVGAGAGRLTLTDAEHIARKIGGKESNP
ncbi:MAG TPA: right-handed parallel beta-helix repeat-containing protein [Armatimonadota bacterium]|jgi:parallel beta-helix repeat protein